MQWLALGPSSSDVNRTPSRPVPGVAEADVTPIEHYLVDYYTSPLCQRTVLNESKTMEKHSLVDGSLSSHMQQPRGDLQVQVATIPGSIHEDRTTLVILPSGRRPSSPLPQHTPVLRDYSCPEGDTGLILFEAKRHVPLQQGNSYHSSATALRARHLHSTSNAGSGDVHCVVCVRVSEA